MFTLDIVEAKKIMSEIVDEFGLNHVNRAIDGSCMYFHPETGEPSCGVGQLFARKGLTASDIDSFENHTAVRALLQERKDDCNAFVEMDARTLDFLQTFQYAQDASHTWGEAYTMALTADHEIYES